LFTNNYLYDILYLKKGGDLVKDRIRKIRKDANLTQIDFAEEIGVGRYALVSYELGRVQPDKSTLIAICTKFNVNQQWLETGEGEPYKTGLIPELVQVLRGSPAILGAFERMVDVMTADDWKALNRVLEKVLDSAKPPDDQDKKAPGP